MSPEHRPPAPPPARRRLSRRAFFPTLLGGCLAAAGYASLVEPYWTEWTQHDLPLRGLPASLDGAQLVHLSDLHAGPFVDDGFLIGVFGRVARMRPTFVVATGDWVTCHGSAYLAALERVLQAFPRGSIGTVGVLGNHDWSLGWRDARHAATVARLATEAGVRILRDEVATIGGLHFAGVEDLWTPGHDPQRFRAHGALPEATIALCHNPDGADHPLWGGWRGWILAGHTHGGQCRPPFLPPPYLPVKNRRYTHGHVALGEERHIYINRGLGNLLHVRFNARPEVTVFTLRAAAAT